MYMHRNHGHMVMKVAPFSFVLAGNFIIILKTTKVNIMLHNREIIEKGVILMSKM